MKYLMSFYESEIYNGAPRHYNNIHPVNREVLQKVDEYSYNCDDCKFDFVTYDSNQDYCTVCGSENIKSI